MTRIIGGIRGGRRLTTPKGAATRPTSDRVREALFSMLESRKALRGSRVLDLYAGSGALGLEAASRGAARVLLVESDKTTAAIIARNIADLDLRAFAEVRCARVGAMLERRADAAYDVVLADPPYPLGEDALAAELALLESGGWLAPDGLVVVERSSRSPGPAWPPGLAGEGSRRYGETTLWFAAPGLG